jgi:chemotaxis regulatin CheY-phosphate phosphatase CheZ
MAAPEFSPLVGQVITAMISQTHDTTNRLIDSLTEQLSESQAEVDAIRAGVAELLDGPYMPTPDAIYRALYPSEAMRERYRRDGIS